LDLITPKKHFLIPSENVRYEKVEPPKGGRSFQRNDHTGHGQYLLKRTSIVKASLIKKEDYESSKYVFLNLKSPQEVTIKSERHKLKKLGFEVLSPYRHNKNVCLARISKSSFEALEERIYKYAFENGNPGKTNIAILEDFEEVPIEDKLVSLRNWKGIESVIIYLYNTLSQNERFAIMNHIESELQQLSEGIESQVFANGATAITCKADFKTVERIVSSFSTIKKVEKNSLFYVKKSLPTSALPAKLKVLPPLSQSVVAIIDSGIESSALPFKNLVTTTLRYLPSSAVDTDPDHGSFVASRCLYGDEIDSCLSSGQLEPHCKVMDVTVFGRDKSGGSVGPDNFSLMNIIGQVVKKYHKEVKVYNLSLGTAKPINDYEYSEVARQVDYLSKTYGVIFVIAAGNIDTQLGVYPNDHFTHGNARINSPAEAILAITVGSIAKYESPNCLAMKDEISPFSRIGPGADGGLKPEIVCHGGNLSKSYKLTARTSSYGINNLGDQIAIDVGTSFSAPIVSQYIVRLVDAFPDATTNLVKALLFHFSRKRSIPNTIIDPHNCYTGFGEPNIFDSLSSAKNTFSYIFEGQLDQQQYQYVGFHIPSVFKTKSGVKLKVKVTIVFDPAVNPINDYEYSMARVATTLFKAKDDGFKEIQVDTEDKYNLPWNPILQFEKEFSRGFSPGYWELRLRLFTRGTISNSYKQGYAVIIEIIDSKNKIDVFSETVREFGSKYEVISKDKAA